MRVFLTLLYFSLTPLNLCLAQDSLKFSNETTIGGFLNNNKIGGSFQHYTGIVLKDYNMETGLVLGMDDYQYFTINPIGVALKATLFKGKKMVTMLGLNTGLGFYFFQNKEDQDKYQSQLFTNPNLSFRFGKSHRVKFNLNIGYKMQKAKVTTITPANNDLWFQQPATKTVSDYKLQRMVLCAGVFF